jgi:hypothetical protein
MFPIDRTVKILLGLIALFLGIVALRPLVEVATTAWAQSATVIGPADENGMVTIGSRVVDVSTVLREQGKAVRGVYVIDSAQSFIVQYDDHFRVYRIRDVKLPEGTTISPRSTAPGLNLNY